MDRSAAGQQAAGSDGCCRPEQGSAQHLLAARAVDAADGRRRVCRHVDEFRRGVRDLADHGAAADVRARCSACCLSSPRFATVPGACCAIFGFTFVSGVMLAPMLQYAAGLSNGGQLVALAGGMTAAVFVVDGGDRDDVEAGLQLPGQVPVRRR